MSETKVVFTGNADQDTLALPATGSYLFAVEGRVYYNSSTTGFVSFAYIPITHLTNALSFDTVVTNQITVPGTV